jgi:acyl-CoA synthetase (AMP-forming)/AMP-acid ligase II
MTTDTYIDIIAHLDAMTFRQRPAPEWHFPADDARLSLSTLRRRSVRYAQVLRRQGVTAGDRVALVLQTDPNYVALLLALWRLNAIAVSLAVKPRRPTDSITHLQRVTEVCQFKLLVHGNEWPEAAEAMLAGYGCRTLDVAQFSDNTADHAPLPPVSRAATDIAVLQLSSGSTGEPKAVIVTHGMIHAQLAGIHANHRHGCRVDGVLSTASWLPLNHDMGLFIGVLYPMFVASRHLLAPPAYYMRNPARWFALMAAARVDFTFTTNSVLATSLNALARLDASSVDLSALHLYVAAEKVSATVLREALRVLAPFGMTVESFRVGYGMAENALGCTATHRRTVSSHHFVIEDNDRIRVATQPCAASNELVAVGEAYFDQEVTVCDRAGNALPERVLGEICVAGPCLTLGYYRNPEATVRTLANNRLRTGDLGFFHDGELYFYARKDDLIISGGRNIVPDDVEHAVEKLDGVRLACACLFAVEGARGVTELVLLVEPRHAGPAGLPALHKAIRAEVFHAEGVLIHHVVLCAKRTVEKTTSGKKRRRVLRERYLAGQMHILGEKDDVRQAVV